MGAQLLNILSQLMTLAMILALLWLGTRAFRRHAGWGLAVLLLSPFAAIAFGMQYWRQEKLPVLVYAGSFTVTLCLLSALFHSWGGWELLQASKQARTALQSQSLTYDEADAFMKASLAFKRKSGINFKDSSLQTRIQHELDRIGEREQIAAEEAAAAAVGQDGDSQDAAVQAVKPRYRLVYKPVSLSEARKYVGATVKVTRRNVPEKEYRLTGTSSGKLHFAQKTRGGTYSFAYYKRDIEKLRVLVKETY